MIKYKESEIDKLVIKYFDQYYEKTYASNGNPLYFFKGHNYKKIVYYMNYSNARSEYHGMLGFFADIVSSEGYEFIKPELYEFNKQLEKIISE